MGGREDPLVDEEAERMAKRMHMRSLVSTSYLYSPYSVWQTPQPLLKQHCACAT